MPQIRLPFTVFLDNTLRVTPISTLFAMGDSNAHRFELSILREGVQESLAGCTVSGKFYRISENAAVDLEGTVEDEKAVIVLDKSCYDYIGRFALTITVKDGENETTVFYGDGYMHGNRTETVIAGEYIIYDIDMLLQKIAEIDAATSAANAAAQNANAAAGNATTAANTASTAASRANEAAASIEKLKVTVTTLSPGHNATADVYKIEGGYYLYLGLPQGAKGETGKTPNLTFAVKTGAPGTDASAVVTGTPEAPHVLLTIPRGDVGEIGNLTINGIKPGADGSVNLTAQDVGARPDTWTPGIDDIDGLRSAIDNAGGVKTVSGVLPDDAGNVPLTAQSVGAMSWTLLWENADTSAKFVGSTSSSDVIIEIADILTYDLLYIDCQYNNSATGTDNIEKVSDMGRVEVNEIISPSIMWGTTGNYTTRQFKILETGLKVNQAYRTKSINDAYMIPARIYGLKGVLANG